MNTSDIPSWVERFFETNFNVPESLGREERTVKLKPGDTVRVIGERGTAKIRAILKTMHGALLETQIGGFRKWNLDELRLVKRGKV